MDAQERLRLGREALQDNVCPSKNEAIFLYDLIQELQETVERYEDSLKTIMKLTSCDDTWDFANRTLENKEQIKLPYRFDRS